VEPWSLSRSRYSLSISDSILFFKSVGVTCVVPRVRKIEDRRSKTDDVSVRRQAHQTWMQAGCRYKTPPLSVKDLHYSSLLCTC